MSVIEIVTDGRPRAEEDDEEAACEDAEVAPRYLITLVVLYTW